MDQPTIDPVRILGRLPAELRLAIKNITCQLQMQDEFATDDLREIANYICDYDLNCNVDWERMACWLTTLLDFDVRIPDPRPSSTRCQFSMFQCAVNALDIPLIRRLRRLGYNINMLDNFGRTAVREGAIQLWPSGFGLVVLRTLCEEGADVNFSARADGDAHILYKFACINRHHLVDPWNLPIFVEGFKLLLKNGASVSRALHAVSFHKSLVPLIKILLEAGADIEEELHRRTPLAHAALMKNPDVIIALIDAGAKVNGCGVPALFAAITPIKRSYADPHPTLTILNLLCDNGADIKRLDNDNQSVLSYALTREYGKREIIPSIVETLCRRGAVVNFRHEAINGGDYGDTALHFAARRDHRYENKSSDVAQKCIEILVSYGANVNSQNGTGQTPLHHAVGGFNLPYVQVLVEHGARIDLEDIGGKTALMYAESLKRRNKEVYAFLVKK